MATQPEGGEIDEAGLFRPTRSRALNEAQAQRCSAVPVHRGQPNSTAVRLPHRARVARHAGSVLRTLVRTELDRGIGFLIAPIMLAVGASGYFALRGEPSSFVLAVVLILAAAGTWLTRDREPARLVFAAMLLVILGASAAKFEVLRANTKVIGADISTRLTARVVAVDQMASGRARLTLDVLSTTRPTLRYAPERIRASARKVPPQLAPGAIVTRLVRLMPPSGPVRPGSYDFSFASYFDGSGASGFFMQGPEVVSPASEAFPGLRYGLYLGIERARQAIAERVRQRIGGAEGEIAAALLVGVRAGIPEEINEALRRSGLYHIISISGLHMALVAATVMWALRGSIAVFPGFASRYPVKKLAAAAALVGITAYLLISGAEVAAQRSFIMLAIMLTAIFFDRAALTMRNLAISAIVVIVISPHEVVGPSFQMSFAATAALVGAYQAWSERKGPPRPRQPASVSGWVIRRMAGILTGLFVTSLIAGLATAAFGAWHFQRVSPIGLLSNLVVMPVVSILVMPFAVAAAVLMPLELDAPFLWVMGEGISIMIALAGWFSAVSPVDAIGLVSAAGVFLITCALMIATLTTTALRLAAIPFALLGLASLGQVRAPDVLISEDARLLAVDLGAGRVTINRSRANSFTLEDWKRALLATEIIKPGHAAPLREGKAAAPFTCDGDLCSSRHASGAVIVHAPDAASARAACTYATLIVVDDATAREVCRRGAARAVTKRDLARFGSASVTFAKPDGVSGTARATLEFSVLKPYRPWHAYRAYSREARGLAPYKRGTTPTSPPIDAEASGAVLRRSAPESSVSRADPQPQAAGRARTPAADRSE